MKLFAFLRVVDFQPAPVLPVFIDDNGQLYIQQIIEQDVISNFVSIESVSEDQIIFDRTINGEHKSVGDPVIYAIEYKSKQIRFGRKRIFERSVSEFYQKGIFAKTPFVLLEFAIQVKSDLLIDAALSQCKLSMDKVSPLLFSKWIKGSDLSNSLKQKFVKENEITVEEINLSFLSTYHALVNLTDFSRNYIGEYRKNTFEKSITYIVENSEKIVSEFDVDELFEIVSDKFRILYDQINTNSDKKGIDINFYYYIYSLESRGSIKLSKDKYDKFLEVVDVVSSVGVERLSSGLHPFRNELWEFFFENRSKSIIFVIYLYYLSKFSRFSEFITSRSFLSE